MKSAYELAMERLNQAEPSQERPLTEGQKERLAEIERVYRGRWAEREIFLKQQLGAALNEGKLEDLDRVKAQLAAEKARLEQDCEEEKEQVRRARP